MNKTLYLLAIYFLGMSLGAGALFSIIFLQQGFSALFLQQYAHFYLLVSAVQLVGYLLLLRYFHFKEWRLVSIVAAISVAVFIAHAAFQYFLLITVDRDLAPELQVLSIIYIFTGTVLAFTFIFSRSKESIIMRIIGVLMVATSILLLAAIFAPQLGLTQQTAMNIFMAINLASNAFPVLYILLMLKELRATRSEMKPSTRAEAFYMSMGAMGTIAVVSLIAIGGQLAKESYWNTQWQKQGPEEAKKLAERFEKRHYVNVSGDTLYYLLVRPMDYDSLQKYPIVTCLHGGPTRTAGNVEVPQPAPLLTEPQNRKKYPAFVFVPQARPGVLWGGIPNIPSMENLVMEAMAALEDEFSIDEKRRYITGGSGGGYGTWHLISKHPKMFAAAIPICGAGDPEQASAIADIPVWAFHGAVDRNVAVTGSRKMIQAIRTAGGNPKYNEFPGVGHNVWPEVEKTEGVLDWFFAQKRK